MIELELKAVVPDPDLLQARLAAAGAVAGFRGFMADRRFDRDGGLGARDEVLRIRRYTADDGGTRAVLGWKGPATVVEGYKRRVEHELTTPDGAEAEALVRALGYEPVHAIDRRVAYWDLAGAVVRLEWYPRMDCLVEVEGRPEDIERAVAATGLPREGFSAEPLALFVARYEARTGHAAAVSMAALGGAAPSWAEASVG